MSNRLTFSLASLILIFALALVATPAMAATGGPIPTITEYSGAEDPNTAASATNAPHKQERTDFRLLVTFNALVTGTVDASSFTVSTAEAIGKAATVETTTGIGTVVPITLGSNAGKAYMVPVNFDTLDGDYSQGYISFVFNADVVTGNQAGHSTNQIQNVVSAAFELTTQIPKNNDWTITASLGTDKPEIKDNKFTVPASGADANTFTVLLTSSGGTGTTPTFTDLTQIQIEDKDGAAVSFPTAPAPVTVGLVTTLTFTINSGETAVATPILVGVNPNWANAAPAGGLRIPAAGAPTPDTVAPVVDIALFGDINEPAKTFEVKFTFAKADVTGMANKKAGDVPIELMADQITLQKQDPDDATMMIDSDAYVQPNGIIKTRDGVFLVTVNYRADVLPVYVGLGDTA